MHYTPLKAIPELDGVPANERNELVKGAYKMDPCLRILNLVHAALIASCFPLAVVLTERVLGHRTLFGSIPAYVALAMAASVMFTRFLIYPRLASALGRMNDIRGAHERP